MKYQTIVVDPPWDYRDRGFSRRNDAARYASMTLPEIGATPIDAWSSRHAHLYLWTTNAFMEHAFSLARLWGFRPTSIITWIKPQLGTGHYYRNTTEHAIFAVRGSLEVLRHNARTDLHAPRGRHSAKPDAFYELVESMSPAPRLDVFARRRRVGWSVFGDQVEGSIARPRPVPHGGIGACFGEMWTVAHVAANRREVSL